MTYSYSALGQSSPGGRISVGPVAARDPLLAFTSVWASNVLRMASQRPKGQRLTWVRDELNKMKVGLGDNFISEYRKLKRLGKPGDQAFFDALRLVLANRIATTIDKMAPGVSGLGGTAEDVSSVFCGVIGVGTAGGAIAASFDNPAGSAAIGQAGGTALQAAGCNQGALAEQARIAEANAAAAQANAAAAAASQTKSNTGLYLAIGGGAVALALVGVIALRK